MSIYPYNDAYLREQRAEYAKLTKRERAAQLMAQAHRLEREAIEEEKKCAGLIAEYGPRVK